MSRFWSDRCSTDPLLDLYLHEIGHGTLLTAEDEVALARQIALGDREARSRMIQANLRLVVTIARQFVGRGLSLDDLIGEGNLGLIRAAQDFDARFGTRFSTYAAYWIKQSIRQALITTTATIRLPAHMVGLLGKWRRTDRRLRRALGREPLFDEIAGELDLTQPQREMVRKALGSRHLVPGASGEDGAWADPEAADHQPSPENLLETREEQRDLLRRLDMLEERERLVLTLRYGLRGERTHTLKEIGQRLGVTREWVRKIETRALRKLDPRHASTRRARQSEPVLALTA
jgi:RNA polymerase primary sigma factor